MARTTKGKPPPISEPHSAVEKKLLTRARKGDRQAYLHLFMSHLPGLDRFIRHEIRYSESIGAVERGLIDPRAIIDQVYIAALSSLAQMPSKMTSRDWLRYLAIHILRQQVRLEHQEEPAGPNLERPLRQDGTVDTDLWEYYQPDDVVNVEDVLVDASATDPEALLELRETENEVEQTINQLPPELRDLLKLRMIEGLSVDEIAVLKGRPAPVIRQGVHEAIEALRRLTAGQAL
jgi:RNA polymerase sigma factor (sigma-70 family)